MTFPAATKASLRGRTARSLPILQRLKYFLLRLANSKHTTFGILLLLAAIHAIRRQSAQELQNSDQRSSPASFLRLFRSRYAGGLGTNVRLTQAAYLTQTSDAFQPDLRQFRLLKAPLRSCQLKFANILKVQGLFDDAESVLRPLTSHPQLGVDAMLDLGDLMLLEANWANEVYLYEAEGVVAGLEKFGVSEGLRWRGRSFAEAIQILEAASSLAPDRRDAWRLLTWGLAQAGRWDAASQAMQRYLSLTAVPTTNDRFLQARVLFALNGPEGLASCRAACGTMKAWRVTTATVIDPDDLPSAASVEYRPCGPAATQLVRATAVRNGTMTPYTTTLHFAPTYLLRYAEVEILPNFGMVLANGDQLMAASIHHKPCHWPLFASAVHGLTDDRAMLCRPEPVAYPESGCVYIGYNNNYYHWILDVLPRLSLLRDDFVAPDAPILADANIAQWQLDLLSRLEIDQSRLRRVRFSDGVKVREVVAPSHLSTNMVAHPEAVRFMRTQLAPHADTMFPKPGKRLYLARLSANVRQSSMLDEPAVVEMFKRYGFAVVDPGALTIDQQIELFADADVIAAPGGAALTNMLYAPRQARILQLTASGMRCETFTSLAAAIGQDIWACIGPSYPRAYHAWVWSTFDFKMDPADLALSLDRIV